MPARYTARHTRPLKIHLDTDIGGDIDDLCALALVLAWPGCELAGVTTVADDQGRRAGYVRYALRLAGTDTVPVAAGADVSLGCFRYRPGYPPEARYWPEPVTPAPGPIEAALDLLKQHIDDGAVIVAIGPWTNLALLERRFPGTLARARLVLMGGHVRPIPPAFPRWGTDADYNVQLDTASARYVLERSDPTIVPIEVTVQTALRRAYLPFLRQAGPLGALIARQAEACAQDEQNEARYGQTCTGLPDDTINFLHDPLACAVALGWPGAKIESRPLVLAEVNGLLRLRDDRAGQAGGNDHRCDDSRATHVVTHVDGLPFSEFWLETLAALRLRAHNAGVP